MEEEQVSVFNSADNLGNQPRLHIVAYLLRIGDYGGAVRILFMPRRKK